MVYKYLGIFDYRILGNSRGPWGYSVMNLGVNLACIALHCINTLGGNAFIWMHYMHFVLLVHLHSHGIVKQVCITLQCICITAALQTALPLH